MNKFIFINLILIFIFLSGCETVKKKSDEVADRENEKYGKFLGKQASDLKIELGEPTEDFLDQAGNKILIYKTKKYGISCERKFEIDNDETIIKFSSSGCI
tara:strand:- start:502 stop:804 length:303 start_codon:yes stop_codon:yes gene_type:complete